ncbi:MAG: DUF2961 domain-containing protein, partial [Dysgonamonadaceae bacterium]|nr:DUF2961 domain-containing protein [Dysgonamonadaceae bacterium]
MKTFYFFGILLLLLITACTATETGRQEIYMKQTGKSSVWTSFENPTGEKGIAGQENKGAKGHPSNRLAAGDSCDLLNIRGAGIIHRIWMTVNDRSPEMLRSLWIKMYWDNAGIPAVSAPLGDFFCNGLSVMTPFENCFFSNPEGRSMNVFLPMPFRTAARIVLINQSEKDLRSLFYDVNLVRLDKWDKDMLYFHTCWNHENPNTLGKDYTLLPEIKGEGRFLGVNVGIRTDSLYHNTWWGEGEVKIYLDGDSAFPSLCGTGTEDYIGTAWGQGSFINQYQGCRIAGKDRMWTFYKFHAPDPVLFSESCRVTLQIMGGSDYKEVLELYKSGVPLIPVTVSMKDPPRLIKLLEEPVPLEDPGFTDGWVNFYRQDDVSSV